MNTEKTKICGKCKKERLLDMFHRNKSEPYGRYHTCRQCKKKYYQKNKEKFKQKYNKNKNKILEKRKEYYQQNRDNKVEYQREYCQKNKDSIKQRDKEYYQKNRKRILEREKKYARENRDKICNRRYNNINYRIGNNLRTRMKDVLKGKSKSEKMMELIGCSIDELRQYLENQFEEGMNWDNYGYFGWHVDHYVPCNLFDLIKPEEQKKCFNFSNLRPLWAKDNLSRPRDGSDLK